MSNVAAFEGRRSHVGLRLDLKLPLLEVERSHDELQQGDYGPLLALQAPNAITKGEGRCGLRFWTDFDGHALT